MRKITAKGGPLDGKTYEVPDDADRIDVPDSDGHYRATAKQASWVPDTQPAPPSKG